MNNILIICTSEYLSLLLSAFTFKGLFMEEEDENSESLCNHSKVVKLVIERAKTKYSSTDFCVSHFSKLSLNYWKMHKEDNLDNWQSPESRELSRHTLCPLNSL